MTIAEKILKFMRIFGLLHGRDLNVEYECTVCKKVLLDQSYVCGDFLVMLFSDGTNEVVKVSDYDLYDEDGVIVMSGDVVGDNICKNFKFC